MQIWSSLQIHLYDSADFYIYLFFVITMLDLTSNLMPFSMKIINFWYPNSVQSKNVNRNIQALPNMYKRPLAKVNNWYALSCFTKCNHSYFQDLFSLLKQNKMYFRTNLWTIYCSKISSKILFLFVNFSKVIVDIKSFSK